MAPPPPPVDEHAGHSMVATTPDSSGALNGVRAFHDALATGDSVAALALLADDVSIQEGGSREDKGSYRAGHLKADIAFARAIPPTWGAVTVRMTGRTAWVSSAFTVVGDIERRKIDLAGQELMVLLHGADGWRIVSVHWSSRDRLP